MSRLRVLNTGRKIILAFLLVIIIFTIVGFIGVGSIGSIKQKDDALFNNNTLGISYCADAALTYEHMRFNLLKLGAITDRDEKSECISTIEENMETVDFWLSEYEKTITTYDNRKIYEDLKKEWEDYKSAVNTSIGYAKSNLGRDLSEYTSNFILVGKREISDSINARFESMFALNKTMAQQVNQQNIADGDSASSSMTTLLIIGVIIALSLGLLISRSIGVMAKRTSVQLDKMAKGEKVDDLNVEKFSGEFINIANNVNAMSESLKRMVADAEALVKAGLSGMLSTRADISKHKGTFRDIIDGFNKSLDAFIAPIDETVAVIINEFQKGNLKASITGEYFGDHASIKNALNDTISSINGYISEISNVLARVAQGDLTAEITSEYRGDFVILKNSINSIIRSFNSLLSDIMIAAKQVAASAQQVSGTSQIISHGATEQASSIEQLTASTSQIASQTRQNAEDAVKTSDLSVEVKNSAQDGDSKMAVMQEAMNDIRSSSENISKIIKVIDDIAFQTNILALNAAVEAARAGVHGKGFAVVAEEVRNLAARSAAAAEQTTTLIENSVNKVKAGNAIADETANALRKIVEGSETAVTLVGGIATASNQQATAIMQINRGIEQLSEIVQSNSASAQETAAAAEELSSQAQMLEQMVMRFNLKDAAVKISENYNLDIDDSQTAESNITEDTADDFAENFSEDIPEVITEDIPGGVPEETEIIAASPDDAEKDADTTESYDYDSEDIFASDNFDQYEDTSNLFIDDDDFGKY